MRERRKEILKSAGNMFAQQFEKSCRETVLHCEERSSEMAGSFLEAFGRVVNQVVRKDVESSDDKVHYLLFSCLYSSIFLKKYYIQIDLMGQGFYNDEPLASSYWDAGDIYCLFERDIQELRRKVGNKVPRIREYETDYIRYAYAPYYHRMAKEFICEMLEELLKCWQEQIKEVPEEKQVRILFGEYMGEADILFTVKRERLYEVFQNLCK